MTIGINQPYYLPYFGLFERISACDLFIINPYTKLNRQRTNHRRVKIIQIHPNANKSWLYLTQHVAKIFDKRFFSDIFLDTPFKERQKKHVKTIYNTYNRAPYFEYAKDILDLMLDFSSECLGKYNYSLIHFIATKLGIDRKIRYLTADDIDPNIFTAVDYRSFSNKASYHSYLICKSFSVACMLAGQNGPLWVDEASFLKKRIFVSYQLNTLRPYLQYSGTRKQESFVPGLSTLDLLFNLGDKSKNFLGSNMEIVDRITLLKREHLTGR